VPVPLGLFSVPGRQIDKYPGVVVRAPYVVCAYLVRHPDGVVLFDTGIVGDAEAVERYRPRCFSLDERLAAVGASRQEIDVVVNCHLHADHAGGNHLFPGTPIIVQDAEIAAATGDDYTVLGACVEFAGAEFRVVSGEHEVLPGVAVVPTPGHSPGHQVLRVETGGGQTVVLAGQAFDDASEFALAHLAHRLRSDPSSDVTCPSWMSEFDDVDVVLFAHDLAQWRARPDSYAGATVVAPWNA
jgi:N-acyl homoserine lactone hydrolase